MPRHWNLVSPDDTGIGDPSLSTAEKGRRFVEAVTEAYARFLMEFARVKRAEDLYK